MGTPREGVWLQGSCHQALLEEFRIQPEQEVRLSTGAGLADKGERGSPCVWFSPKVVTRKDLGEDPERTFAMCMPGKANRNLLDHSLLPLPWGKTFL